MSTQKTTIATIVFLIVLSFILVSVRATETIELWGGRQASRIVSLVSGDRVKGTLACINNVADIRNPVDFWIVDPDDNTIALYVATLGTSFSFVASKTGVYTMYFDNNADFLVSTVVILTIDYSINEPEPVISSENIPYIIMTAIAVSLAVGTFLAFRRNRNQPPSKARYS